MEQLVCPICGKTFIKSPCNIYKIVIEGKLYHLCSWGCLREAERQKETKKKRKEE